MPLTIVVPSTAPVTTPFLDTLAISESDDFHFTVADLGRFFTDIACFIPSVIVIFFVAVTFFPAALAVMAASGNNVTSTASDRTTAAIRFDHVPFIKDPLFLTRTQTNYGLL